MVYSKDEFLKILKKDANLYREILTAFQETINNEINSLDHHSFQQNQNFFVNNEFEKNGLQFIATWYIENHYKMVIPLIYVSPKYRRMGHAKYLITTLQKEFGKTGGFIQLSIKLPDIPKLAKFYENNNFNSEIYYGIKRPNRDFLDFFWSIQSLNVSWSANGGYSISPKL